jgi:hypothetical protein
MGKTVNIIEEMSEKLVRKFDSDVRGTNTDAIVFTKAVIEQYNKEVLGMTHKFESFQTIAQKKRLVVLEYYQSERDAEYHEQKYLEGIAKITNRDFGISTSITEL